MLVLGTIDPDPVATQKIKNRSRPRKKYRSRPVIGRDPEKNSGRDRTRFATQKIFLDRDLEIFWKICQDIQLDKSNIKFLDRVATDIQIATQKISTRSFISGRDPTVFGSRSDIFIRSRP
jgi:hypothetical protein